MRIQARLPSLAALALVAGCTQGSSQIETAAMLPRPQVVVVQDFAVWPRSRWKETGTCLVYNFRYSPLW